jgi:hypothetical protein
MRRLLACLVLAGIGIAAPAVACLNDDELPSHEREFRSQYAGPALPSAVGASALFGIPVHRLLGGAGGALLIGATAVAWVGSRPRD